MGGASMLALDETLTAFDEGLAGKYALNATVCPALLVKVSTFFINDYKSHSPAALIPINATSCIK